MALNAIDEALQLTGGLLNGNVAFAEGVKGGNYFIKQYSVQW